MKHDKRDSVDNSLPTTAMDLFSLQKHLEMDLLKRITQFEKDSGMFVHAAKIYRGPKGIINVEVSAMLRWFMKLGEFIHILSSKKLDTELDIRGEYGEYLGFVAVSTSEDGRRTILDLSFDTPWCPIDLDHLGAANEQRY
jgi:hypothetical protein